MRQKASGHHPGGTGAVGADNQGTRPPGAAGRRSFPVGSVALIAGLLVYGLFATDLLAGAKTAGDPAPDLGFSTVAGEFRLAQQKGKVVVLYFAFPG